MVQVIVFVTLWVYGHHTVPSLAVIGEFIVTWAAYLAVVLVLSVALLPLMKAFCSTC